MGFRALFAFLALSVSLHVCASEFVSASDEPLARILSQSIDNQSLDSELLGPNGEGFECCVFAAQHTDRGQILPVAISADPTYQPPVLPPTVIFTTLTPGAEKRFELDVLSELAIARVPVYLSTQRLRN
jgi:hypothetical protein